MQERIFAVLAKLSAHTGRAYSMRQLEEHSHNGVYEVDSAAGGDRYIFKTYHTKWKQAHEVFAMNALRGVVPVPQVVERGTLQGGVRDSLPFLLMSRLPGEPVNSWWPDLERDRQLHLVKTAGAWLRRMHQQLPMDFIGLLDENGQSRGGYFSGWGDYLAADVQRWRVLLEQDEKLARADASLIEQMTAHVISYQARLNELRTTVFLHRDYGLRNLLMTAEGELSGVIDFEHGLAGDGLFDLVRMVAETLYGEEELLEAYATAYLCRPLAQEERVRLRVYLAHHAVSQFGYGWREGATEEIQQAKALMHWLLTQFPSIS